MKHTRVWCRVCGEGRRSDDPDYDPAPDIRVLRLHCLPLEADPEARVQCGNCGHEWWARSGFETLPGYRQAAREYKER